MKVVVDASVLLSLLLPDEKKISKVQKLANLYATGKITLYAPPLIDYEVLNGLRSALLAKRITLPQARKLLKIKEKIKLEFVSPDFSLAWQLSLKHQLSIYDASYLAVAKQKKLPLLSWDQKLQKLTPKPLSL